ncbi:MAG TPA: abortive infection system antitoxin AbiGi family protein [Bacteroidia bacterium]|jgi:hypothetical protein|nr:abortive infection system antitoxin AbiGi family protein [Bacteroidia bacterium]
MSVSANTLFHFTRQENLLKIIDGQHFYPNYSKEHFINVIPDDSIYEISYIPMISFCDLKLTQLSNPNISLHTKDFGEYGLGFQKKWGVDNKVSPVVYVHKNSRASQIVNKLITTIRKIGKDQVDKLELSSISELIKFLKPYDGHYQKGIWKKKVRRYYDEREWRFIPDENKYPVMPLKKSKEFKERIEELNDELKKTPLKFTHADIKYIIVKEDSDKNKVAEIIRKSNKGDDSVVTDLITRIITLKQLEEDY